MAAARASKPAFHGILPATLARKESLSLQDKALSVIEKSRGDYGSTAIAEISTSAPFFGRAATWIVARAGAGFLKCAP
jgi:hypothetical protein